MPQWNNAELANNLAPYFIRPGETIDALAINKYIYAGDGLTGGGLLTSDVTLNVGEGDGINVLVDSVELQPPGTLTTESRNLAYASGHSHEWNTIPINSYTTDLGAINKKYLQIHAAELWVDTLVAQDTLATIGGRVLVGPTTWLTRDLDASDSTMYVQHNQLSIGDIAYFEQDGSVEFIGVTSAAGSGSELLSNTGFETAGAGGADVFANWTESASDGSIVQYPEDRNRSRLHAYIYGDYASASSQQAYIATMGPGSDTSDSQGAFIEGYSNSQLITDPSLESWIDAGTPTYWTEVYNVSRNTTYKHSGISSCRINTDVVDTDEIYQDITVTGSTEYEIKIWSYYETSGGEIPRYNVYDNTNSTYLITTTNCTDSGADQWTETVDTFTTASNTVSVRVRLLAGPTTLTDSYVDDITVTLVPVDTNDSSTAFIEGVYYPFVYAGQYSAQLTSGSSVDTYIYQDVTVTGGDNYTLSFWNRGDRYNAGRYQIYDVSNGADIKALTDIYLGEGESYRQTSVNFTAPATCNTVRIYLYSPNADGGATYFDDVSVTTAGYSYSIVRNLDGTGANNWYIGTALFNTGERDDGFIDMYSIQGIANASSQGPTIVGNVRTSTGSEILSNTGFETAGGGGADIWATWTETAGDGTLTNETSIVNSGSDACKITTGASDNTLVEQSQAVTGNTLYTLSFWTRGDGATAGRYGVWDYTNSAWIESQTSTGVSGTTYTEVVISFVTPSTCVSAGPRIYAGSTNGDIAYFDDFSMTAIVYNDWVEHWAIGNLEGVYGQSADVYGVSVGRYGTGYTHIMINEDDGFEIWYGDEATGTRVGNWDADGDIFIGSDIDSVTDTYLAIFANAQTYNSEAMEAGDLLIGDNTTGGSAKANLYFDYSAGVFHFRSGQTSFIHVDSDGFLGAGTVGAPSAALYDEGVYIQAASSGILPTDPNKLEFKSNFGTSDRAFIWVEASTSRTFYFAWDLPSEPANNACAFQYDLNDITLIIDHVNAVRLVSGTSAPPYASDGDVIAEADVVAGGGLYVGDYTGTPVADCAVADGDGRFAGGLAVGSSTLNNSTGNANITGGLRVGDSTAPTTDDIRATGDVIAGGGLYAGNVTYTDVTNGEIISTSHIRCGGVLVCTNDVRSGGGVYSGNSSGDAATGCFVGTGDLRISGGGSIGSASHNPAAGNLYVADEILVGTTTESDQTTDGIKIYHTVGGFNGNEYLACASDCTHGMTTLTNTNHFFTIHQMNDSYGGAVLSGFADSSGVDQNRGLLLLGVCGDVDTTDDTGSQGAVGVQASKASGTGRAALGATENCWTIQNYGTTHVIMKGNGDLHQSDTSLSPLDDYNDVMLLTAARFSGQPPESELRQRHSDWVEQARPILEKYRIMSFGDDGRSRMYCTQKMQWLTIDAIRQIYAKMERMERALVGAGIDISQLED